MHTVIDNVEKVNSSNTEECDNLSCNDYMSVWISITVGEKNNASPI